MIYKVRFVKLDLLNGMEKLSIHQRDYLRVTYRFKGKCLIILFFFLGTEKICATRCAQTTL